MTIPSMVEAVIFDWKRTLYDPDSRELIDGATDVLGYLGDLGIKSYLIGKGGESMYDEVDRLGVNSCFDDIIFKEGKKSKEDFGRIIGQESPEKTYVIGDRVRSEIEIGNTLSATTIQVRNGKFADEMPENDRQKPSMVVVKLRDLIPLFDHVLEIT